MVEVSYKGHFDNCSVERLPTSIENIKNSIKYDIKNLKEDDIEYLKLLIEEDSLEIYDIMWNKDSIDIKEFQELMSKIK